MASLQAVAQALADAIGQNEAPRSAANIQITQWESTPGFASTLLDIFSSQVGPEKEGCFPLRAPPSAISRRFFSLIPMPSLHAGRRRRNSALARYR